MVLGTSVLNNEQRLLPEELKCTHAQCVAADCRAGHIQVLRAQWAPSSRMHRR